VANPSLTDWVCRWRDEVGYTRPLVVARIIVGGLLFASATHAFAELRAGYFGDAFHWPLLPEALVLPRAAYEALLVAQIAMALLVVVGVRARAALVGSALSLAYVMACDRLEFHNNRWALACDALLLGLTPCDRSRVGPLWAARLLQVQTALIYVASGGSKLLDPDWRGGRVIMMRMVLYGGQAIRAGVPRSVVDCLAEPRTAGALAALAIATELFLAVGLWPKRTRAFALFWGVGFHLTIEATSRVEGFTWLTLGVYALFATPDRRARTFLWDGSRPLGRVLARAVRALDWLDRFETKESAEPAGGGFRVIGRDGQERTGIGAAVEVARAIPLLFPLWIPLAVIAAPFERH
jgi:hypothetical protein